MPELPDPKSKPHIAMPAPPRQRPSADYAELQVTSNFSFLRGGSHPEELAAHAAQLDYRAIAVTDINSLAGIVRAHVAAKEAGIPFLVGCHIQFNTATESPTVPRPASLSLLLYPTDRAAYGRLCRMLTIGKRRASKGQCDLTLPDVIEHQEGCLAIAVMLPGAGEAESGALRIVRETFQADRLSLAMTRDYGPGDAERLQHVADLSKALNIPLVATNDVHYHVPERQPLQDILTCIRLGCTIHEAGFARFANAERHLKGPDEMTRLFRDFPQAIARTAQIAERAGGFSLDQLRYEYPDEICPPGQTMMDYLIDNTWRGARERYPAGVPDGIRQRLDHEFALIRDLNYPAYFLTVWDIVNFARSRGILCQGRGAAANSAVCYCLGVTAVDPSRVDLLVERFISRERNEPPDIDIDFEHERREEVIQYIYQKYGRDRAALTAEVISYRRRSALRQVGKAMGLSLDCVDRLAKSMDWWDKEVADDNQLRQIGLDPRDPTIRRTIALARELIGFPRHLSQHVGGFVITQKALCESVPIENAAMADRTVIEWDKDDIDALGMLKVDVLGLGMLTAIRKAIDLVNQWDQRSGGAGTLQFHTIPPEDPGVYDMLCNADSVGVFQVESRAQMTMLPRLRPRNYYDLVIEVAVVRPGPIQGGMVHPYLRRRSGQEPITYPNEEIRKVLGRTLGVPLFQEQAMRLAMVAAGFSAGEADQLRRAMAAWKRKGDLINRFGEKIIAGMLANGYTLAYAHRCFEQIKGFGDYGFPESHAASFALLVYVSAWLKKYHPAAFAAALINSQPMGFYQPAQLVRDAQGHGVEARPIDVNHSQWDCTLEASSVQSATPPPALRLGMRLVKSLSAPFAHAIARAVGESGPFESIPHLWRASMVRVCALKALAQADAFNSIGLTRQTALWNVSQLRDESLPLFDADHTDDHTDSLPRISAERIVVYDYAAVGLSLKAHPLSFARERLNRINAIPAALLLDERLCPHGKRVTVAGLALVRQRPATASGILFMTIEDETGIANLVVRPNIYDQFKPAIRHAICIVAQGRIERQGQVVHVLMESASDLRDIAHAEAVDVVSRDFR